MTKFSRAFWTANLSELFERMAYYVIFIVITLYLSNTLGFNDIEASLISGLFSWGLYFLPMFTGAFADKIGYRKAILLTAYCPDPALYDSVEAWKADAANAHYIWYWFTGIGAISAIALIIYAKATKSGKWCTVQWTAAERAVNIFWKGEDA